MKKSSVEKHFDQVAQNYDYYKNKNRFYYDNLKKLLRSLVPPRSRVFEVGCGTGDLLSFLKPSYGYGMDISGEMVKRAKSKHGSDGAVVFSTNWPNQEFDFIFMSDVVEHLDNHKAIFLKISNLMGPKTIFINTMMNPVWEPVEIVYAALGLKMPEGPHYRISYHALSGIAQECEMKIIRHDYRLLMPINIPYITSFLNRHVEKYLRRFSFIEYFIAVKA